ncbi:MAG TPA: CehA/McbA family metallohydrolase [Pirellulales bacterium]|nr:CehA/McbA family metallohydrolase [Pirellulales bacterium]
MRLSLLKHVAWLRMVAWAAVWAIVASAGGDARAGVGGQLEINVVDHETGQPVACRVHLTNQAGKVQKPPKVPFWHDHFVIDGNLTLKLPSGNFNFVVERGPEYLIVTGHFEIHDFAEDSKTIELRRFVDMSREGWWSGDLEVERPRKDIELLMQADDLHVAELVTWGNLKDLIKPGAESKTAAAKRAVDKALPAAGAALVPFGDQRYYRSLAGLVRRPGGSLVVLGLDHAPPEKMVTDGTAPELIAWAREQENAWIDLRRATSWDLPIWIALGMIDSIELADSQLARGSAKADPSGTRPHEASKFADPGDVGRWTETVYYHLLNCGLRIPPTAGSGSGVAANPVGYNRVYVHVDQPMSYQQWLENLRAGQVVVTNGPLIRPNVGGELPGYVFQADAGQEVSLEVGLTLSTRDPISYLEIVQNGRSVQEVRLDQWKEAGGKLPPLKFRDSGWFVVRAVTDVGTTHRFASTGPYYVEIGKQPRISRAAVQFFLDWLEARAQRAPGAAADRAADADVETARTFWQSLLAKANAD